MKSKAQIITELKQSFNELLETAGKVPEESYNLPKDNKWSTGENIQHLVTSTKMTRLPFSLPKPFVRLLYGKPNRASKTFDGLVHKYQTKLQEGGKASGPYVPKKRVYRKDELHQKLKTEGDKLVSAIEKTKEEHLDEYVIAHPLLGKISLRELCYFTIYHNQHHCETIREVYVL